MKTKTILLFTIVILLVSAAAQAQDQDFRKNEVRLGYGLLTGPEMANSLFSIFPAVGVSIWRDTITDYMCSFYGAADLEYNHFFNKWIAVGVSLSFNPISTIIKSKRGKDYSYNYYLINVMPKVTFQYMKKEFISMYSSLEAGGALILWRDRQGFIVQSDAGGSFAFHINAFGIRVGKDIGAYMEWGFGFRGTVNFGISGRF